MEVSGHAKTFNRPILFLRPSSENQDRPPAPRVALDNFGIEKVFISQDTAPSWIAPKVWLGSEWNACNRRLLVEMDISHFVNAGFPRTKNHFSHEKWNHYFDFEVEEDETALTRQLVEMINFIDDAVRSERNVLIYCSSGTSRSAFAAVAYLIVLRQCSAKRAIMFVRQQRPEVDLSDELLGHLLAFESSVSRLRQSSADQHEHPSDDPPIIDTMEVEPKEDPEQDKLVLEYEDDDGPMRLVKELEFKSWNDLPTYKSLYVLDQLADVLRGFIFDLVKSELHAILSEWQASKTRSPHLVKAVTTFIEEKTQLLRTTFGGDASVTRTFHRALMLIPVVMPRIAEALTAAVGQVLVQSRKKKNGDGEGEMDHVIVCGAYIPPSLLHWPYLNAVAKRILMDTSPGENIEMSMLDTMKEGHPLLYDAVSTLFKDISVSKDICQQFHSQRGQHGVVLSVYVLSASHWPASVTVKKRDNHHCYTVISDVPPKLLFTPDIEHAWNSFAAFYSNAYPGRRMQLACQWGSAEVTMQVGEKKYFLTVSTSMMAVLTMFNTAESLSYSDIIFGARFPEGLLQTALRSLIRASILITDAPILTEGSFKVNDQFQHGSTRVNVVTISE
eukprot:TRINITY_DN4814_c0_g1_i1.p1 TRINITY_DN4814_c0_g1~~TRINITY_DN4814_c0_g1_i1.p1  ORF type:complete len:615 (-),score=124.06 TRINITY_DN4814_c0_g1_i1:6-1850(-)